MFKIYNHYVSRTVFTLLLIEILILMGSVYLGVIIRFYPDSQKLGNFFLPSCVFAFVMVFSMGALGMYQHNFAEDLRNTFLRLMPSFALGLGIITLVFYWVPDLYFGRGILGFVIIIAASGTLLARALFFKSAKSKFMESRIIFLGAGALARGCRDMVIRNMGYHKYNIVGFIPMPDEECCVPPAVILPANESLASMASKYNASEIVVSVQNRRGGAFPIQGLLECKLNGIKVTSAEKFFEREVCQIKVDSLQPGWLIFGGGFDQSFLRTSIKRAFDLFSSVMLFIVTLPIMLVTALCIFIEDRAPIFYQQERVGKDGHTFMVFKFRSMRNDAEKDGSPQWASAGDPRTTKVGRIIRKLRIDELPQILNVIKGEMSFVGPRPERPYFVKQLSEEIPYYNVRHSIKPGITGLAQVRYQYGASVDDAVQKLQYDLYYVKNNSLFLDVLILIDTIQVVLFGMEWRVIQGNNTIQSL